MRRLLIGDRIYDGSGAAPFAGGVLVDGARIVDVFRGPVPDVATGERLDAGDRAICPGFIDLHTHSDVSVLSEPGCVSAIAQGITTQLVGQCGFSAAPVSEETIATMVDDEPVFGFPGIAWSWTDLGGYLSAVRTAEPATNIVTLVGHGTVRRLVLGGVARPAGSAEIGEMAAHVTAAMKAGAAGLSTGLSYAPGIYADDAEIHQLARVAGRFGRRYHTHMRYGGIPIRVALAEAIRVAADTGVAVNVSHLYPSPTDRSDEAGLLLADIDAARDSGLDVTFDLTVFTRGGGAWLQTLPGWAREGGLAGTRARIADTATRRRLEAHLDRLEIEWDDQLIVKVSRSASANLAGKTIGEVARERGESATSTALQLVVEDGQFWVAPHIKRQADLEQLIAHPTCVPVTDGMAAHPVKHRDLGAMPKTFGTVPLVLGRYVRERGVLTLETAIKKLTSMPAERIGLAGRGLLAPGRAADLVVFDPDRVANNASEDDPTAAPTGIEHVLVNGSWALRDGRHTGAGTGQALTV